MRILGKSGGLYFDRIEGVVMRTLTERRTRCHASAEDESRITSVPPLSKHANISQAHMSNAILRTCPTRVPGAMLRFPGDEQITSVGVVERS